MTFWEMQISSSDSNDTRDYQRRGSFLIPVSSKIILFHMRESCCPWVIWGTSGSMFDPFWTKLLPNPKPTKNSFGGASGVPSFVESLSVTSVIKRLQTFFPFYSLVLPLVCTNAIHTCMQRFIQVESRGQPWVLLCCSSGIVHLI